MLGSNHLTKEDHVNKDRFCTQCGEKKPGSHFISKSAKCRSCRDAIWEENQRAKGLDPQQVRREKKNERRARKRTGELPQAITMRRAASTRMKEIRDHYDQRMVEQQGLCAICNQPERQLHMGKVKNLCRDHDHRTGQLRGLLCTHCNSGLGHYLDDPALVARALAYLLTHSPEGIPEPLRAALDTVVPRQPVPSLPTP